MNLDEFIEWIQERVSDFQNHYESEHEKDPAAHPITKEDESEWCNVLNDFLQE